MRSTDTKVSCFLAVGIFLLILFYRGTLSQNEIWRAATSAVSSTIALRFIFLKWAWKWRFFSFLEKLHGVPNLEGKWQGRYNSTWSEDGDVQTKSGDIEVKIIQPDLLSVKITQRSGESISHSYGETFEYLADGTIIINFSYKNDPEATVRERSQISYGSARYELIEGVDQRSLKGNYFTDRKTTGVVVLEQIKN